MVVHDTSGFVVQAALFDYDALDSETRIVVQQRTGEIKSLMRRAAQDIIDIGQKLIEVKARLGRGNFDNWIKAEFGWERATAYRFIQVSERFSDSYQIDTIAPSALYLLAAPSTPEPARVEALARAEQGEAITHAAAKDIVQSHKLAPTYASDAQDDDEIPPLHQLPDLKDNDEPLSAYEAGLAAQFEEYMNTRGDDDDDGLRTQQRSVLTSHASIDWYTPAWCIDAVRAAFGGSIELDPASSPVANCIVQAQRLFTEQDDGLVQEWSASTVFCNPPYNGDAGDWSRKAVSEHRTGRAGEVILLVFAKLGYRWFQELFDGFPTCLVRERIAFLHVDGTSSGPAKHASAFVYLGPNYDRFREVFAPFGRVLFPHEGRY